MERLDAPADLIENWLANPVDGALIDEVRARFEGVPALYGHVIVDEAQDVDEFQLRAVLRRSAGVTLVGDDAQRSAPGGLGLPRAADVLETDVSELTTAYRMSAEIADWLNAHADSNQIESVSLVGIRATGVEVCEIGGDAEAARRAEEDLRDRWPNVATITSDEVWIHKGVEYDAVVVLTDGMDSRQVYLAASRAAHELVVVS